jgi:hypothetical protein
MGTNPKPDRRRRIPLTLSKPERKQLDLEAHRHGLKLAAYIRMLVFTHPARAA